MIGRLSGTLIARDLDHVMIDVGGVGYLVFCTDRTLSILPSVGEEVSLFTDLLVREDLLQLFGFATLEEKAWHKLLMGVQGVGAKASMAILGALGAEGVSQAVTLGDWAAIKSAKGIGPKTAQKVVIELKDKAPSIMAMSGAPAPVVNFDVVEPVGAAPARAEALSALKNLGYGDSEAAQAVAAAMADVPDAATGDLIRMALKSLGPK